MHQTRGVQPAIYQWKAEGIAFQRVDLAADAAMQFHKIFYDEIVVLAFSKMRWTSEQAGTSYLETPESVIVRAAGQVFSAKLVESDANASCREIHLSPQRLASLYGGALPKIDFARPLVEDPALAHELMAVHRLFEAPHCELEATTRLAELLASIGHRSTATTPDETRSCSWRTQKAIAYLRAHFADKVTLTDLADVLDANPFVLLRQFRKEMGVTPHDYLRAYRIYRAKQFIARGMALSDVAFACGFADQSHLNRQFKRNLGVSPKMYRSISSKTAVG